MLMGASPNISSKNFNHPQADAAPTPASDTCPYGSWDAPPPAEAYPPPRSRRLLVPG